MKSLRKPRRLQQRKRLIQVVRSFLEESCSVYGWYNEASGYLRGRRFDLLYALAERLAADAYASAAEHLAAVQFSALLSKYPFTHDELGIAHPRDTAVKKFEASEIRCRRTNRRFLSNRYKRSRFFPLIEEMRRDIEKLVGLTPDMSSIYRECAFSSGSAIGVHGNATNLYRKLCAKSWTATPTAAPYAIHAICSNEQFLYSVQNTEKDIRCLDRDPTNWRVSLKMIPHNKLSFVPKTAKTLRVIAVEPLLNSYVQKGIDMILRRKLLYWGIDLSDQSRNQELARLGSIYNDLSTIDLSSASDSVSSQLVRELLPSDWFCLLNNTRSPSYKLDGTLKRYEKFVSMGNGFCFPLETIIFAAAVRAVRAKCTDRRYAVYGDDIICPSQYAAQLIRLLAFLGFRTNQDKTFLNGPFRESCGADWYKGQDVRPVYLDYHLDNESDLMIFHNATYRSERVSHLFTETRILVRSFSALKLMRPRPKRPALAPKGADRITLSNLNGAFDVDFDVFMHSRWSRYKRREQRWSWKEFLFTQVPDSEPSDAQRFEYLRYLSALQTNVGSLSLRFRARRTLISR